MNQHESNHESSISKGFPNRKACRSWPYMGQALPLVTLGYFYDISSHIRKVNQLRNGKFGHIKFFETEARPLHPHPTSSTVPAPSSPLNLGESGGICKAVDKAAALAGSPVHGATWSGEPQQHTSLDVGWCRCPVRVSQYPSVSHSIPTTLQWSDTSTPPHSAAKVPIRVDFAEDKPLAAWPKVFLMDFGFQNVGAPKIPYIIPCFIIIFTIEFAIFAYPSSILRQTHFTLLWNHGHAPRGRYRVGKDRTVAEAQSAQPVYYQLLDLKMKRHGMVRLDAISEKL